MRFKRIVSLLIALVMIFSCMQMLVLAKGDDEIKIYIDNTLIELKNPCTVIDGVVYIPMEEVFFKLGIYMSWDENNKCYIGNGNNGEIRVTPGDERIEIDWIPIEMPGPVRMINSVCMVPIYIIEDAARTTPATYSAKENRIDITFPELDYQGAFEPFNIESVIHLLPEGQPLLQPGRMYAVKTDTSSDDSLMRCEKVTVEGMPFTEALEIETYPMPDGSVPMANYSIQKDIFIDGGNFNAGDVGLMTFWARATKITDESGMAGFRPCYEQLDTWNKAQEKEVKIGPEWKKYYLPMYSGIHTLKSGASHLTYSVGYKPQIIQIAEMQMYNYGTTVDIEMLEPGRTSADYKGMEEDHLWRKEAWRRIDKYRKDDMVIRVRDKEGNPVEGATVTADMTEQEFLMGVAPCARELVGIDPDNSRVDKLRMDTYKLFNTGVSGNEMKDEGHTTLYRDGAHMINDLLDLGMRARGHALSWDEMKIKSMATMEKGYYDINEYEYNRATLLREVAAEAWMFRNTVVEWDGLNEPHDSNKFRTAHGMEVFADVFKIAKAVDPKAKLIVNETGMEGRNSRDNATRATGFIRLPDDIKLNYRGPIDGVGIQGHCTNYLYPMGFWWDIEILTQAGYDSVTITEYDFINQNSEGDARHLYDTFLACFSHPKCGGFVIWGIEDSMHWRYDAPFFDRQWNAKPELAVWKDMVENVYATHETVVTDTDGNATIRGFRGKYKITVDVNGVKKMVDFTLTDSDDTERDNYIDIVVDGGNITASNPNPHEVYAKRRVTNDNSVEAYAEYLAAGADKWIATYTHRDQTGERVSQTVDGLMNTYWYGNDGDYVEYELVEKADKGNISVDFRTPNGETYKYEILVSVDGENWNTIYAGTSVEKTTVDFENVMFIRVQSVENEYMGISEVNIHAEKE